VIICGDPVASPSSRTASRATDFAPRARRSERDEYGDVAVSFEHGATRGHGTLNLGTLATGADLQELWLSADARG
jgi:hypothetical protein